MLFHTTQFLEFFFIFLALYAFTPKSWQNTWLFIGSAVFYGAWSVKFLGLLVASAVLDYYLALAITRTEVPRKRLMYLWGSIVFNLGVLGVFKYYNFFISGFIDLASLFGLSFHPTLLSIALPIGISFYTFQTISYTADVYYKKIEAERSLLNYCLFVFFFPHMVAGPIMRADFLLSQIRVPRAITQSGLLDGVRLFLWGAFKKVVIADSLSSTVDSVFGSQMPTSGALSLIAVYSFAIQIYCDFSGYTDMARGVAGIMGFRLPENFNWPYFSKSIPEFWRRWHISLSTWLKDYAYLPMAQSFMRRWRGRPVLCTCAALFITFTLCGLWHGAGWPFILWGAYFGAMLAFARLIQRSKFEKALWSLPSAVRVFLTFHLICFGWLIFRSQSLSQAGHLISTIATGSWLMSAVVLQSALVLLACALILFSLEFFQFRKNSQLPVLPSILWIQVGFYLLIYYSIILLGQPHHVPFVYFQF